MLLDYYLEKIGSTTRTRYPDGSIKVKRKSINPEAGALNYEIAALESGEYDRWGEWDGYDHLTYRPIERPLEKVPFKSRIDYIKSRPKVTAALTIPPMALGAAVGAGMGGPVGAAIGAGIGGLGMMGASLMAPSYENNLKRTIYEKALDLSKRTGKMPTHYDSLFDEYADARGRAIR